MDRARRRIVAALATLASVGAVALAVQPAYALNGQSSMSAPKRISYFTDRPIDPGKPIPVNSLPAAAQAQLKGTTVSPQDATPRGYTLREGGPNGYNPDYRYDSAYVWAIEGSCDLVECESIQQVRLRLTENVAGTDSKRWSLVLQARPWSGPTAYDLSYFYECGVNIPDAIDQTCSTWRDDGADGPDQGEAYDGMTLNYSFGGTNNVTKFPMVNMKVEFADGSQAIGDDGDIGEKFRGWDVCVTFDTTKLCPSTGTGN